MKIRMTGTLRRQKTGYLFIVIATIMMMAVMGTVPSLANIQASSDTNTFQDTPVIKQELQTILTSENYVKTKTVRSLEKKQKDTQQKQSWFITFLEKLLNKLDFEGLNDGQVDTIQAILTAIKILLVVLLIWVLVWLSGFNRHIRYWLNQNSIINKKTHSQVTVKHTIDQTVMEHEKVPDMVKHYLSKADYLMAASVLYRGSLDWLNQSSDIIIYPANTEYQCMKQIQQIHQYANHQLSSAQVDFLMKIIQIWMLLAYANDKPDHHYQSLKESAIHWLDKLPIKQHQYKIHHSQQNAQQLAGGQP